MDDVELFDAVGFRWDRDAVAGVSAPQPLSVERVVWRFMRALPEFVWDSAQLEGNPFTYPEVQTLLEGSPSADTRSAMNGRC